ncbi:hypothetical protein GS462_27210 [Rhodococcus hoagii]|nr:hypothetical protein [Prescottella equi]
MFTTVAVALVGLLLVVNILILRPHWWIGLVVFTVIGTFPSQVPERIYLGSYGLALSEIALGLAVLVVSTTYKANIVTDSLAILTVMVTAAFSFVGFSAGIAGNQIANDSRGLFGLAAAMFIVGRIAWTPLAQTAILSLRWVLYISLGFAVLGSLGAVAITARLSDASIASAGSSETGIGRVQSATTHTSAVVLAVCFALLVAKKYPPKLILTYAAPAFGITMLGFSRNALAIIAITLIGSLLLQRRVQAAVRTAGLIVCGTLIFLALGGMLAHLTDVPGVGYVHRVFDAYTDRVIDGFSQEVQESDSSLLYRAAESANMRAAIDGNEFFGQGMGFEYQTVRDKNTPTSSYYGHNFYLWAMVKCGIVGLVCYLFVFACPIVRAARDPLNVVRAISASAALSLILVSIVAPMPLSSNAGPLLGALLGLAATAVPVKVRNPIIVLSEKEKEEARPSARSA